MAAPPPIPLALIECIRFEGSAVGLHTAGFDRKRLDAAQTAAREWLASQPSVDVVSIESCFGNLPAFVTVWYRRKHQ